MVLLRPYRPDDLDALYRICLLTGDSGEDASPLHNDPQLIGHIYAAPYGVVEPEHVFVAEDDEGVGGYLVGTQNTDAFAGKLERDWWPALRQRYAEATGLTAADRGRIEAIVNPERPPADLVAAFPAHIHMNLMPRLRGQRVGTGLLHLWIEQARQSGVAGIHLGASTKNAGGVAFWQRSGFAPKLTAGRTVWLAMALDGR